MLIQLSCLNIGIFKKSMTSGSKNTDMILVILLITHGACIYIYSYILHHLPCMLPRMMHYVIVYKTCTITTRNTHALCSLHNVPYLNIANIHRVIYAE